MQRHLGRCVRRAAGRLVGRHFPSSSVRWLSSPLLIRRGLSTSYSPIPLPEEGRGGAPSRPRAAALIIGNEILTGKVKDINTHFLSQFLFDCGVVLTRSVICTDEVDDIAESVRDLSARVGSDGFVFTSGGIGPTHDDRTYDAIAAAFGRKCVMHQPTADLMGEYFEIRNAELRSSGVPDDDPRLARLNAANLRMATLPEDCVVHKTPGLWVPLVQVENVYILPGIPRYFRMMVSQLRSQLLDASGSSFTRAALLTDWTESRLAEHLAEVQRLAPEVSIGSYPRTNDDDPYTTKLTFEGTCEKQVARTVEHAMEAIPGTRLEGHVDPTALTTEQDTTKGKL